jgi:hypothetical protein
VQDRGVAVQHLEDEQVDRDDRIELPLAPAVPGRAAGVEDRVAREQLTEMPLDSGGRRGDALSHPWPPVRCCREATPLSQEASVRASAPNARGGAGLWLFLM